MNEVVEEMLAVLDGDEDVIKHYGVKRRSGRYPYGSGEDPYQHGRDFLGRVEELRKQDFIYTDPETGKKYKGDTAIAKSMGLTTTQFRTEVGLAKDDRRMLQVETAKRLRDKEGLNTSEIGRKMGVNESTVRSWFNEKSEARMKQAKETAEFIKKQVDERGMIDIGTGVERELNVSPEKLKQALYILEKEGYPVYKGGIPQATNPGQQTNQKVICPPGTKHKEIYNFDQVHSLNEYITRDDGKTFEKKFHYPESMDSKRLQIRYKEDGGIDKDGIIELRRGVDDLSLGESRYAQVRILVDGKKYLKGMAVYSDNMPDGVDVVFNTNKSKKVPKLDVLKDIKDDPDNPFGSLIKDSEQGGQYWYTDKKGNKKLGLINKARNEGDWDEWSNGLPSQFLSKQSLHMAKKQLDLAKADKLAEYDDICSLNNPTIKKHLLQKFSDECDSAAVSLKAAALPGQKYHVIIPVPSLKDNEVYAPNYSDGTKLALVRYPHGGTFEIPILKVNNKQKDARKLIGTDVIDAVCINSKVAERLSGADFDGDTVMCIPTHDKQGKVKIASKPNLKGLEGFDPKMEYPERPGMKYMKDPKTGKDATQMEMGRISNLITDMTLAGASDEKLARAVRHSMVVIDAAKHKLDYKQSEKDNDIASLRKEYQAHLDKNGRVVYGGASTIISRASGEQTVLKRQGTPKINLKGKEWYDPSKPEGSYIYKTADDVEYKVNKTNKRTGEVTTVTKYRHQKSTKMAETDDANTLVSEAKHPMELAYANYANSMKALANKARLEMMATGKIEYDKNAKAIYKNEVKSLEDKLKVAESNRTRERAAQRMANAEIKAKEQASGKMKPGDKRKAGQQALTKYREELGSVSRRKRNIDITDKEWEAIQAGAISENKLRRILNNTDIDKLRQRATPKTTSALSAAKINRAKALASSNYTLEQIAKKLGVSTSTVSKYLKGVN